MTRSALFAAVRPFAPAQSFTPADVTVIDMLADKWGLPRLEGDPLTERAMAELIHHEAIVLEAYKDSAKPPVWTWSVGLTAMSGIDPLAFKDKPSTLGQALKAFVNRCRNVYAPDVIKAFGGRQLSEAQFAGALAFHYNTGAIGKTDWVKMWCDGKPKEARAFLTSHYLNGGSLQSRRDAEAALFFDGKWGGDGTALIIPVSKPSYQPAFGKAKRVAIMDDLRGAMP